MCKLSREAVVRQLEQVKKEYGLLQKVLSHWADHSCSTEPTVRELREAAKGASNCLGFVHIRRGKYPGAINALKNALERLRKALEAMGEK